MKKLLSSSFLIFVCISLYSQDLIINQYGDSIRCKITMVRNNVVYFQIKSDQGISGLSLPVSQARYRYNYFKTSPEPSAAVETAHALSIRDSILMARSGRKPESGTSVMFSVHGGPGFEYARLGENIPKELSGYYQNLRSGLNFSGGLSILLEDCIGLGIKYSWFHTSNSKEDVLFQKSDGTSQKGRLSDNIRISLTGPEITYRNVYRNGNAFFSSYYMGYVSYRDDALALTKFSITGSTLGLGIESGYDVELNEHFILAFQASIMMGVLRKVKYDNGFGMRVIKLEEDEYENLGRIDFGVGLRFR